MQLQRPRAETLPLLKAAFWLAVAAVLLWLAFDILLLLVGGALLGVGLSGAARWVEHRTPLGYGGALAVVLSVLAVAIVAAALLAVPALAGQVEQITAQLPDALRRIVENIRQGGWSGTLLQQAEGYLEPAAEGEAAAKETPALVLTVAGGIGSLLLVIVLGVYGAAEPVTMRDGLLRLFPIARRARVDAIRAEVVATLRRWLRARLLTMTIVGALVWPGLWALDVPLSFLLAVLAALLDFIPNVGPLIAAAPGVLMALGEGTQKAAWVLMIYLGIQLLEGYLISPFIEERAVCMPLYLILAAQVLFGVLGGPLGLALATPIAAATLIIVRRAYVEDALGDDLDRPPLDPAN